MLVFIFISQQTNTQDNFVGATLSSEFPMTIPSNLCLSTNKVFPQTFACVMYCVNLGFHDSTKTYTFNYKGKKKTVNSTSNFSVPFINAWKTLYQNGQASFIANTETVMYRYMTTEEIYKYVRLVSKQLNKKLLKNDKKLALGILSNARNRYKNAVNTENKMYTTNSIIHIK